MNVVNQRIPHSHVSVRVGASLLAFVAGMLMYFTPYDATAAQPAAEINRDCTEVWGVDGWMPWRLCAGHYLTSSEPSADHGQPCRSEDSINKWAYWPGHPGFLVPTEPAPSQCDMLLPQPATPIPCGATP
jgi:hypothetical protein